MTEPVWTPYKPEDCIEEFGWLWMSDGPMGPEWALVYTDEGTEADHPETVVFLDDRYPPQKAEGWQGTPYLPCSAPTVEPGKCDALEVAIRFAPGASATHAFGDSDRLEGVKEAVFAAMGLGRGEDG